MAPDLQRQGHHERRELIVLGLRQGSVLVHHHFSLCHLSLCQDTTNRNGTRSLPTCNSV